MELQEWAAKTKGSFGVPLKSQEESETREHWATEDGSALSQIATAFSVQQPARQQLSSLAPGIYHHPRCAAKPCATAGHSGSQDESWSVEGVSARIWLFLERLRPVVFLAGALHVGPDRELHTKPKTAMQVEARTDGRPLPAEHGSAHMRAQTQGMTISANHSSFQLVWTRPSLRRNYHCSTSHHFRRHASFDSASATEPGAVAKPFRIGLV